MAMAQEHAGERTSGTDAGSRSVVASTFVTLDGYMVGPDEDISWVAEGFDPQMQEDIAVAMSRDVGVFVFGRVTFEIFAEYWPNAIPYDDGDDLRPSEGKEDPRIIRALNESLKLVFSKTLEKPEWKNTRVVDEGLEDEIRELKQQPGKPINVQGSASIVQALERADLIDEYRLYVHPVLLGAGKPLFATGINRQDFELSDIKQYANGVVSMTYKRKVVA
jgi:dihydrofolate reductase